MAILAGFFLAGRALVTIRSSWDKQQRFVADASHELRTPLAVMQINTEMLLRYPKHTIEEESEHISIILKELRRMIHLVSDLLTLARSESNQIQIKNHPFLLDQTITEMLEQYGLFAEIKNIRISIAKWIVEAHKGKIRIESNLGFGTDIYVHFPLKVDRHH